MSQHAAMKNLGVVEVHEAGSRDIPAVSAPGERFAARVGAALLLCGNDSDEQGKYSAVISALQMDSRVRSLDFAQATDNKFEKPRFATTRRGGDANSGADLPPLPHHHWHALAFRQPIQLHVQVPRRVQARGDNREELIPSDEYWAIWDGVSLIVMWREGDCARPFHDSGGIVVLDVLRDAAKEAKLQVRPQPCGPNCNFPFAHSKVLLDPGHDEVTETKDGAGRVVLLTKAASSDPDAVLREAFARCGFVMRVFAELRASARAISQSEEFASRELTQLLTLHYQKAAVATKRRPWTRIKAEWATKGFQRQSRRLEALLWLRLAGIERQHRRWTRLKQIFDTCRTADLGHMLFALEYPQDQNLVTSLDTSSVRSAVEQIGTRVDSRVMAWATGAGAIVGAAVGTVVGRLG